MGDGVSTGDEIFLGFICVEHDGQDSWFHLCYIWNVVCRNSVFSLRSGNDDLLNLSTIVNRIVRNAEIERDGCCGLGRFAAETSGR